MLRYFSKPQIIGLVWAAYAFTWSLGSLIAHRFRAKLNMLILCTTLPLIFIALIDNWFILVVFMFQAVAAAALINQIETRIQENTPSAVRASMMSVLATIGRAVSVPASFILGWLFRDYSSLVALRCVAVVSGFILVYWFFSNRKLIKISFDFSLFNKLGKIFCC